MFDQLVESSAVRRRSNRWIYFSVTGALWVLFVTGIIVWGIVAYDAKLNEQFNLLTLLSPPRHRLLSAPPPPAAAPVKVVKQDAPVGLFGEGTTKRDQATVTKAACFCGASSGVEGGQPGGCRWRTRACRAVFPEA
jgi:hypothetical protein